MNGLIARKVGMSRIFLESGEEVPVTYLEVRPNVIVRMKTKEKDGYDAVVVGVGGKMWRSRKGKEHTRYSVQKEWRVDSLEGLETGKQLSVDILPADSLVTITGVSKGKGFQGVMRRWNFSGGPASHGSHFKREPGTIGMRTQPGRVLKGHHMAGRMGGDTITLQHRSVVLVDSAKNVLAIKGPIPGPTGSTVFLTKESTPDKKE